MLYSNLVIFSLSTTILATPITTQKPQPPGDALLKTLYQFPNKTWVENIAIRRNGKILVSHINEPEVWQIDPSHHPATAELIHRFPEAISAMALAEVSRDVFVVPIGNFSDVTGIATQGSWSVWEIDFNDHNPRHHPWSPNNHNPSKPSVRKITSLPTAKFPNGATPFPPLPNTILIGDSGLGTITLLNTATTHTSLIVSNNPALAPNATGAREIGINGLRYRDGYAYFVNTFKTPLYSRIPLAAAGRQAGPVEVIAERALYPVNSGAAADDFALDRWGNAWLATASDTLVKITPEGKQSIIAGGADSKVLVGCTSAAFGRTKADRDVLYISTDGGLADPSKGVEGGKVVMLDTRRL